MESPEGRRSGSAGAEHAPASYLDEIWPMVPEERPLDRLSLEFALGSLSAAAIDARPRVLDVGCGDGRVAARLAETGVAVSGVDPSDTALARARRAHPALELARPAPDGRLPFGDSSFDVAVCLHVLEHVADTQLLLSETRRVLVPRGLLVIAVPWHGRIKGALIALRSFERHYDPLQGVLRFYTPASLRSTLADLGFEDIEVHGAGGAPLLRKTLLSRARRGSLRSGL